MAIMAWGLRDIRGITGTIIIESVITFTPDSVREIEEIEEIEETPYQKPLSKTPSKNTAPTGGVQIFKG